MYVYMYVCRAVVEVLPGWDGCSRVDRYLHTSSHHPSTVRVRLALCRLFEGGMWECVVDCMSEQQRLVVVI